MVENFEIIIIIFNTFSDESILVPKLNKIYVIKGGGVININNYLQNNERF